MKESGEKNKLGYHGDWYTMHAMFVAVMLAVGADQPDIFRTQPIAIGVQPSLHMVGVPSSRLAVPAADVSGETGAYMVGSPGVVAGVPGPYHYDPPRDPQEADGLIRGFFMYCQAWFQPMPQTCYTPHYGCYPGNGRDIYRTSAFHGYYYRQAYNYRPLFEYPWQADMHEPLPFELSMQRSTPGRPQPPQPQGAEVIESPTPHPLRPLQ